MSKKSTHNLLKLELGAAERSLGQAASSTPAREATYFIDR
jgi:hypothetical protein